MPALVLNNLRSVYNVGSLFRTADAAGVDHVYLVGVTPGPVDRFGRARKDFHKTALGAEEVVPWSAHENLTEAVSLLKKEGYTVVAVEQHPDSIPYRDLPCFEKVAYVLGEETQGIPADELALCDHIVEIPQRGVKESLNVSVAGGVVLFR